MKIQILRKSLNQNLPLIKYHLNRTNYHRPCCRILKISSNSNQEILDSVIVQPLALLCFPTLYETALPFYPIEITNIPFYQILCRLNQEIVECSALGYYSCSPIAQQFTCYISKKTFPFMVRPHMKILTTSSRAHF